ncbi:MAG: hypothetical protein OEM66_04975, partial [Acidimicrobiia bacterium]|nr:hypothetical protein [Acidimicrobiia bacterium]
MPIAGRAQFITSPVDIAAPVSVPGSIASAPDYYSLTAETPTRYSDTPLAIGFATLDHGVADAVARLTAEFGEPDEGEGEGLEGGRWIFGRASWIGWYSEDEWAFYARANPQGDLRLALYDGLVLGASTVA